MTTIFDDIEFELEQSKAVQTEKCDNRAPCIAYKSSAGAWSVVQGCCNDWTCKRCGQIRARKEYGRIVYGAEALEKEHDLFFITLTCRGRDMTYQEAEKGYLEWTNRALTTLRAHVKASGQVWTYASVTERQERKHPHSHYLTTFAPSDTARVDRGGRKYSGVFAKKACLDSEYLTRVCDRAGLGYQVDISQVESAAAVSRYVSKYLFKDSVSTVWPKGWRRVRYSQNWPKLPDTGNLEGFPLLGVSDWLKLEALGVPVQARDSYAYEWGLACRVTCLIPPKGA